MQTLRGFDDRLAVFELAFVELAEVLVLEDLGETDEAAARAAVEAMCEKLLANTVIENYEIDLDA